MSGSGNKPSLGTRVTTDQSGITVSADQSFGLVGVKGVAVIAPSVTRVEAEIKAKNFSAGGYIAQDSGSAKFGVNGGIGFSEKINTPIGDVNITAKASIRSDTTIETKKRLHSY